MMEKNVGKKRVKSKMKSESEEEEIDYHEASLKKWGFGKKNFP